MSKADAEPDPSRPAGAGQHAAGAGGRRARILLVGNANVDVLMGDLAPWPQPGTEVVVDRYELRVGGAAGNTGLALAALGAGAQHGSELIAAVGEDALGRWLEAELDGVMQLTRVPAATALTVGLTHPDGQRTFVSYMGHLHELPLTRIESALEAARPGDLLLLCGYFLMPGLRRHAPELLRRAKAKGVITALDTGWPPEGWTEQVRNELLALLPDLGVFLPNREELLGVTGLPDAGAYDAAAVREGVKRVREAGLARVVVKLGGSGALYAGPEGEVTFAAPAVKVQDTVGAGDTFNAGLLVARQRGYTWTEALKPAVQAASLAIASSPRRYPNWAEVDAAVPAS